MELERNKIPWKIKAGEIQSIDSTRYFPTRRWKNRLRTAHARMDGPLLDINGCPSVKRKKKEKENQRFALKKIAVFVFGTVLELARNSILWKIKAGEVQSIDSTRYFPTRRWKNRLRTAHAKMDGPLLDINGCLSVSWREKDKLLSKYDCFLLGKCSETKYSTKC